MKIEWNNSEDTQKTDVLIEELEKLEKIQFLAVYAVAEKVGVSNDFAQYVGKLINEKNRKSSMSESRMNRILHVSTSGRNRARKF